MSTIPDETPPPGWRADKIGKLFDSWGGLTPPKANASFWGPGLPWVSSQDVKSARLAGSTHNVTSEAIKQTGLRICPPGSVLVVMRSGVLARTLPVSITEIPVVINQDLKAFYSEEPLMNEWLALFLRFRSQKLLASSRRDGTTVQSIQYPLLRNTLLPIPPPDERRQIIKTLETYFAKQHSTARHIHASRHVLQGFRHAVLTAACAGRLTADWRSELGLSTVGKSSELPDGWKVVKLGDLAISIRSGSTEVPENAPTDFPILRSSSVRPFEVDFADVRYLTAEQSHRVINFLQEGNLLITRLSGSIEYVGSCAIVDGLQGQPIQYPDRLFCCRLHDSSNARFVELAFAGPELRRQIEDASRSAAGHQRISISDLKNFHMALPPLNEQREIVRRASKLLSTADVLLNRIDDASRAVERSSHAILAKTFREELVSSPKPAISA